MFAVEVQDAQGRVVPITDNEVTFKVSGAGKLIGVGQWRSYRSGIGQGHIAKGVLGLLHGGRAGNEKLQEHHGGGDVSRTCNRHSVRFLRKPWTLRPQVAVWEREVPTGAGHHRALETSTRSQPGVRSCSRS